MTDNTEQNKPAPKQTATRPPSKRRLIRQSRPDVKKQLSLQSVHAQRVASRVLRKVSQACYTVQVHLPNIAGRYAEIGSSLDEYAALLTDPMKGYEEHVSSEITRTDALLADNAISDRATYSRPLLLNLEITSPGMMRFAKLLVDTDFLIIGIDTLWISSIFSDNQRSKATYELQQRMLKLGHKMIDLGRTTHKKLSKIADASPEDSIGGEDPAAGSMPEPLPDEELDEQLEEEPDAEPEEEPEKKVA